MIDKLSKIRISRPIYFLCGPKLFENTKRVLLHKFLVDHFANENVRPFPIIVDDIFQSKKINNYGLDIGLLEDIVSAISFKTYLFLDSLSTAYEYGAFENSRTSNSIVILLEESFRNRKRRDIGIYLKNRFKKSTVLLYKCKIKDEEKEYYEFENDSVPPNLVEHISKEMNDYKENLQTITIQAKEDGTSPSEESINVQIKEKIIDVTFSLKSLFYYMSYYLSDRKTINAQNRKLFKDELRKFRFSLKGHCLSSCGNEIQRRSLYEKINIHINGYSDEKTYEIIRHIYFFFVLLKEYKRSNMYKLTNVKDYIKPNVENTLDFEFGDFFDSRFSIVDDYLEKPDNYIDEMHYKIHKKYRVIYKYKDSYKGKQLRQLHEFVLKILNLVLPTNDSSFAYKESLNTSLCIQKHKMSTHFIKTDIHNYFNSIRYRKFKEMLEKQLEENAFSNGIQRVFRNTSIPFLSSKIIRSLFYKGKLPLGFVTSPKISDYYLKSVDDQLSKTTNLVYTRYADDILFSTSKNPRIVKNAYAKLRFNLKALNLDVNKDKTKKISLLNENDYLKFLGLNIIKKDDKNIIKIPKYYKKKMIQMIRKTNVDDLNSDEVVLGKLRYIKYVDFDSYQKTMHAILKIPKDGAIKYQILHIKLG